MLTNLVRYLISMNHSKLRISVWKKSLTPYPCMEPFFVHQKMKSNSATVFGDIPIKVIKRFGYEISFPLSDIFKRCCNAGEYPDIWKMEIVTPAPKKYPPQTPNDLTLCYMGCRDTSSVMGLGQIDQRLEYLLTAVKEPQFCLVFLKTL